MIQPFSIGQLPRIEFGAGRISLLPGIAAGFGQRLLLVTGGQAFLRSKAWPTLQQGLAENHCYWERLSIKEEPSPEMIDAAVATFRQKPVDVVIGIGGGSVLDAAKAIAGLLRPGNSVMDHLEGVGPELPYQGPATPFIAVPTTAGTGSEATKNAVLSRHGAEGFKKSFRDEQLMATYAIVDADLLASCPPQLIAANGMDALTQLLEAFVSTRSNPLTDALALSGIQAAVEGLLPWYEGDPVTAILGREKMAYAALMSGICLAQTGLGSVHGLAQPLGSFFPIPHGVVCGTLLAAAVEVNVEAMQSRAPDHPALKKYAHVGRLILHRPALEDTHALAGLVEVLKQWTVRLQLPTLSALGVKASDFRRIVDHSRGSSMKTNPVVLDDAEIERIIRQRLN
jgi:alcohol dehydrogenase